MVFFIITTVIFLLIYIKERMLNNELLRKLRNSDPSSDTIGKTNERNSSNYDLSYIRGVKSDIITDEITKPEVIDDISKTESHHKVSSINAMLILGALLIIISGFIFATTTWASLGNIVKAVIILSFSAILFAVSSLAERKLELPKTGRIFYVLGCAFLPITVFAVAFFKIFGVWFSFEGGGTGTVLAVASLLTAVVCFKGGYDYKSKLFAFAALTGISACVISIAVQIFDNKDYILLTAAVYSLTVIIISRLIQNKGVELDRYKVLVDVLPEFELTNTIFLSFVSLIIVWSGKSFIFTLACGAFAAAYVFSGLSKKNEYAGAIPFTIFVFIGVTHQASLCSFDDGIYVWALIATIISVFSLLKVLPASRAFNSLSCICVGIAMFAIAWDCLSNVTTMASVITSVVFTVEVLVLGLIKRKEASGNYLLASFSFLISLLTLKTITLFEVSDFCSIPSAVILLISVLYVSADIILNKKGKSFVLRSVFTDVVYSAFALGILFFQICGEKSITITVLSASAVLLCYGISPKKKWEKTAFIPLSMLTFSLIPLGDFFSQNFETIWIFTAVSGILALITIMLSKRSNVTVNAMLAGFTAVTIIYICLSYAGSYKPICQLWFILGAVYFAKIIIEKRKRFVSAGITLFCIAFGSAAKDFFDSDLVGQLIFAGLFASVLFAVFIFADGNLIVFCRRFSTVCLNAIAFALLFLATFSDSFNAAIYVGVIIILAMTTVSSLMIGCTSLLTMPLSALYFAAAAQSSLIFVNKNAACLTIAVIILFSVLASYIVFNVHIYDKQKHKFDCFAISRCVGLTAYLVFMSGEYQSWSFIWLFEIVIASFLRKGNKRLTNRIVISFAMLTPVFAWWFRPFAKSAELISVEINIVPILLYVAALRLLKWDKKHIDSLTFSTYLIVYVILFLNAINGALINAIILMASAFIILVISFFIRIKRWFILGTTVITASAIFLSIKQWGSPAWWVYLLAAGVILIAIGALNERKKNSAKGEFNEKISRFMSEWTW